MREILHQLEFAGIFCEISTFLFALSSSSSIHSLVICKVKKKQQKIGYKGMGSGTTLLKVVLQNFDVLAGPFVALVYPLYASVRAIETKSPVDDQQWLTYWVLYSLITLFELTFAKFIEWLPFWSYTKLLFTCWLVLPYFSGAAYVYEHFVRPFLVNPQTINIWYVPRKKDVFSKPDDILVAAEKYIEENGREAFEKIMKKTNRESKTRRSNSHMIFGEDESHHTHNSVNYYDEVY